MPRLPDIGSKGPNRHPPNTRYNSHMKPAALIPLLAFCAILPAQTLVSPWDAYPPAITQTAYRCPAPPASTLTLDPGTYYTDSKASITDPAKKLAYQQATEAPTTLSRNAALAADFYLEHGSLPAAQCVVTLLNAPAEAHAWTGKMPDYSGVYTQNWTLSAVAIAYLKVRTAHAATPQQDTAIQAWFDQLAHRITYFFILEASRLGNAKENNHMYWAGLALTAEGIADDDLLNFQWGLGAYQIGIDNIQPDGSLTAETARGQMAMHYHLYALAPLIITAELAEANHIDLYTADSGAIQRLVALCTSALEDPTVFEKRTGIQQIVEQPYAGSDIGWAVPYVRRFPNPQLSALIAKAPWTRYTTWGGTPPP